VSKVPESEHDSLTHIRRSSARRRIALGLDQHQAHQRLDPRDEECGRSACERSDNVVGKMALFV